MADEHDPPLPTASPHVQPALSVVAEPPAAPPEPPLAASPDFTNGLLRPTVHLLIGAVVGAVLGLLLNFVLFLVPGWTGDWRLLTGCGFLVGVFFNRYVLAALRLTPARERDAEPAARASRPTADAAPPDGLRETVETIVFVLVLVLMLKSFDAEAFVIPTGSMAETLLGYQKWVVCPNCGYKFPANCSQQVDPTEGKTVWVSGCTCPNCRQHIHFVPHDQWRENQPPAIDAVPDPDWGSGDRVLVSKFAYDLLEKQPDRLDVVVFKYPGNGNLASTNAHNPPFPQTGPFKDGVPMNYIKRLIGLPGETIAIHDGDLYVLPPDQSLNYDDLKDTADLAAREQRLRELWQTRYMHNNEAVPQFKQGEFRIIRKPPDTMLKMRRIVCDNDHPAQDVKAARWADRRQDGAWKADDAHGFRLAAPADDRVHWLGYRHLLRGEEDKPQLITDFMGYNDAEPARSGPSGVNWVGDLILECEVQAEQAQGELTLELSKGVDRFRARFDLGTGVCTLLRDGQDKPLDSKPTGLKGGGQHSVRFADVDQRLTVWVDDALPFGDGVEYDPPSQEGPTEKNDLEPTGIGVKGVQAAVHGLRLWRDTYYTAAMDGDPAAPDAGLWLEPAEAEALKQSDSRSDRERIKSSVNPADPASWDKLRHLPTRTMYVQPGHYLCLGDNSPQSSDGRLWGLVPERLLLGKALDVYYPFDRFGRIR